MTWRFDATTPRLDSSVARATMDGWSLGSPAPTASPVFTWAHTYAVPKKVSFELRRAKFGDGYEQRNNLGINNTSRQWNLTWKGKSEPVAQEINDFFEARSDGKSFSWKPLFLNKDNSTIKVICVAFDVIPASYNSFDITATFEQVYGE